MDLLSLIKPLPTTIDRELAEAQATKRQAQAVTFTDGDIPTPDLSRLDDATVTLIRQGAPKGDRSEAIWRVALDMIRAGYSDDEIRAVMRDYPIGEKYDERGDKWLAHTVGKAREWADHNPADQPAALEEFEAASWWVRADGCVKRLRAGGIVRLANYVTALAAVVKYAKSKRARRFRVELADLGNEYSVAPSTAHGHLNKLAEVGLIGLETVARKQIIVDLSPLLDLTRTESQECGSVQVGSSSPTSIHGGDFFTEHIGDDAFTSYPYTYAIRRREIPTALAQSLGATALLLWEPLLDGGTVKELAAVTGLTEASVRASLKRYRTAGLLFIWKEGRANVYQLHPNAEQRLEERREHMVTAGVGQMRMGRNESRRADGTRYSLKRRRAEGDLSKRVEAFMEERIAEANAKAVACFDALERRGINPYIKVAHRRPKPRVLKKDPAAEWEKVQPLWDVWIGDLGDLPASERRRIMGFMGYESNEIDDMLHLAKRAGKVKREFIIAPEPVQAGARGAAV